MSFWDSKRSLAVAVFAAIGASVCCVGPLLLLTMGIGGVWVSNLLAFEPYRPVFIGVALIFFGLAFHRLYLQKPVCTPGTVCAQPVVATRQRVIFWLAAVLVIFLLWLPDAAPLFM